ncbi:MAG TPA: UbiA family prenyltransferase [Acidobacteriota bacterium]|nr:UbiA family prenyltransferase [Acidobacteriota bacterium]
MQTGESPIRNPQSAIRNPHLRRYWNFVRPFTLLVPAIGMMGGSLVAWGAPPRWQSDWGSGPEQLTIQILLGGLMAAVLNAGSNALNQIFDLELDRINKPERMLPAGQMTMREAWAICCAAFITALAIAAWINWQCFLLAVAAVFLTASYSVPPLRTKRHGIWANLTIAIPRGTLLFVAGWSVVKTIAQPEPWWIGAVFGIYFLGATTTKDFSDIEGDRVHGCNTLPVLYGVRKAAYLMSPFLIFPFLLIAAGALAGVLHGNRLLLVSIGLALSAWGSYIAYLILRKPEELSKENHVSWKHMYLLTVTAQVGMALAYLM